MEKQKKIYCGSGKKKSESWLQVSINPEKFSQYIQEFNGNKFLKLNINIKNQPDQYGKDVEVTIDTWKPDSSKSSNQSFRKAESAQQNFRATEADLADGNLPF